MREKKVINGDDNEDNYNYHPYHRDREKCPEKKIHSFIITSLKKCVVTRFFCLFVIRHNNDDDDGYQKKKNGQFDGQDDNNRRVRSPPPLSFIFLKKCWKNFQKKNFFQNFHSKSILSLTNITLFPHTQRIHHFESIVFIIITGIIIVYSLKFKTHSTWWWIHHHHHCVAVVMMMVVDIVWW